MCSVVRQRHRHGPALGNPQQSLGAGLLQRSLVAQSSSHQRLHPLVRVIGQRLKLFIALGQRQCLLASCGRDLCRWYHAQRFEDFGKLLVGHQVVHRYTRLVQQFLLAGLYL